MSSMAMTLIRSSLPTKQIDFLKLVLWDDVDSVTLGPRVQHTVAAMNSAFFLCTTRLRKVPVRQRHSQPFPERTFWHCRNTLLAAPKPLVVAVSCTSMGGGQ